MTSRKQVTHQYSSIDCCYSLRYCIRKLMTHASLNGWINMSVKDEVVYNIDSPSVGEVLHLVAYTMYNEKGNA